MSSLRERLTRFKSSNTSKVVSKPEVRDGWEDLHARCITNPLGQFIIREKSYSFHDTHGLYSLGQLHDGGSYLSSLLTIESKQYISYTQMLFLDTETTGLGVGTGNLPFMIGLGYFTQDRFIVEQLFVRNPSEEAAMLFHLQQRLDQYPILLTYNGKSFDWPLLKNRFILHRLELKEEKMKHLDFLYPARSLWRYTLPTCRLGNVEEERLGIIRQQDIPGSLAPTYYFQYLAEEDPALLVGVFRHNEADILSLVSLAIHFSHILEGRLSYDELSAEELYRLGIWLNRLEKTELASQVFQHLLMRSDQEKRLYLTPLAAVFKKLGEYEQAVSLWHQKIILNEDTGSWEVEPYIELAKYYEHQIKDYSKALSYAEEAYLRIWKRYSLTRGRQKDRLAYEEVKKRIKRLQKKGAGQQEVGVE